MTTLFATLALGCTATAKADIVFQFNGVMSRSGYPSSDPLGSSFDGASIALQIRLPDVYSDTQVWGTPAARAMSDSLTITTNTGAKSTYSELHGGPSGSGILFSPNYSLGGQFLATSSKAPHQFENLAWKISDQHTLTMQRFLNTPNGYVAGLLRNSALDKSQFGQLISHESQLFLNGHRGSDAYSLSGSWDVSPASAPEPTTTAIFGLGGLAAAIGAIRRRLSRKGEKSQAESAVSA